MKKLAGAVVAAALVIAAANDWIQAELVPVVIYQTNDVHGSIGPTPANPRYGTPASGGAASLATLLKRETRPYLWIDSGDWFQGTPEGNLGRGEAVIAVFNALHLTAGELGNHDYDYGEDNVKQLAGEATFPILGANISSARTGATVGYVKSRILKQIRQGVVIGVFGLLTQSMPMLVFPESIRGLQFGRPNDAAAHEVQELRREGANIVIAASHLGIEEYNGKIYEGLGEGDISLAKNVPGIDFILGSHTHTQMRQPLVVAADGHRTVITQTRGMLSSVYQIVLYVDSKTGRLDHSEAKLLDLDPAQYPPDPAIAALVASYQALVEKEMGRPIGSSAVALRRKTNGESVMGNWVTDVLRRYGKTDMGIINTFGIRGDIPAGPVTYGDVYRVMPFENRAIKMKIVGSELKKLVELNLGVDAITLQYSGIEIVYDPKAPAGGRLKSLKVGGIPVPDDKTYTFTSLDFAVIADQHFQGILMTVVDKPALLLRDLLVKEIQDNSPISSALEGRIKVVAP